MSSIRIVPLGAGQDVGRSCILVSIGGKNVMFDCGMHMGYNDERRFPDFSYIARTGPYTDLIDALVISHFHLDHCGALPFFTEMMGYDGPIYMTSPTKAICPILLEDYRKITVERKGETNFFTSQMIKTCIKKVITVDLHQTIQVDEELSIKAYYAGHVLGAAMFRIQVGSQSVVYTGDYNMTPDRHLGAAWIDKCRPDVLITESTYATTIRDSKRCRESNFLKKVHDCVNGGGKVLIPVFALGRAQELCILLETYWERNNLKVPIYFSAGLTEKANHYYKLFISWTNQKIKSTFVERNMFEFKHIKPFARELGSKPGPMVLFATPGMLHAGLSLQMFKRWAPDPKNMVIMPGYCVAGTVGAKVLAGKKNIEIDKNTTIPVRMSVEHLSFSAHADAKGIMQLIRHCEAQNIVLVHGEKNKMDFLKKKVQDEFNIDCFNPANGVSIDIQTATKLPIDISQSLLKRPADSALGKASEKKRLVDEATAEPAVIEGIVIMQDGGKMKLLSTSEAAKELGLPRHQLGFSSAIPLPMPQGEAKAQSTMVRRTRILSRLQFCLADWLHLKLEDIAWAGDCLEYKSLTLRLESEGQLVVGWSLADDRMATKVIGLLKEAPEQLFEEPEGMETGTGAGTASR